MKRSMFLQAVVLAVWSGLLQQAAMAQGSAAELQGAVMQGNLEKVKSLIADGADINAVDRQGWTPLYTAIQRQQKEIAEYLVAKGADVTIADRGGMTPLHAAAFKGDIELVGLLIEKGADVNGKDRNGGTPLHLAAQFGWKDVVELLLSKGADVNLQTNRSENALSKATKWNRQEVIDLLVQHGAKEPVMVLPDGERLYGDPGSDSQYPRVPGQAAPLSRTGAHPVPRKEFVLGDPNAVRAKIEEFDGLREALDEVINKSRTEERSWLQRRIDNRTSLARAVQAQVEAELTFARTCAIGEKAKKTTAAVDDVLAKSKKRSGVISKELLAQRREQRLGTQNPRSRGRGQLPSRGARGVRGNYSRGRSRGRLPAVPYQEGAYADRANGRRAAADAAEPLDPETEALLRAWTGATLDNRTSLARSVHGQIWTEMAAVREVAVEEGAKKTTVAIDGLLLSRQERLAQRMEKMEEARRSLTQPQGPGGQRGSVRDPRMRGQQGYMQDGGTSPYRRPPR